jgi:hypothetical protein
MAFRTEWDTEPNPLYDIWTSVNGSEVVPRRGLAVHRDDHEPL